MEFGPAFQKLIEIEAIVGQRECRTVVSLEPAEGKHKPQSYYPIHPAALGMSRPIIITFTSLFEHFSYISPPLNNHTIKPCFFQRLAKWLTVVFRWLSPDGRTI